MPAPESPQSKAYTERSVGDSKTTETAGLAKIPYTISCASSFRDAVLNLAARRGVNVADVARSVLLCISDTILATVPDPGDAPKGDREAFSLKSGEHAGQSWRRKPRLQMRLPAGLTAPTIRRALALALALDEGASELTLAETRQASDSTEESAEMGVSEAQTVPTQPYEIDTEERSRLLATIAVLSFDPLPDGVQTRDEALYVFGLPPGQLPHKSVVAARFRMMATIHHPDSPTGSHARMAQLNEAISLLRGRYRS